MARKQNTGTNGSTTRIPNAGDETVKLVPKHLSKQEFARRLYKLMISKGWRQSELARRSGLPRDSISTYMRAKTFPTPQSVKKLADALGVEPTDILPNYIEGSIDEDTPMLEMKVSPNVPGMAWLRVNQLVPLNIAVDVLKILQEHAPDRVDETASRN